MSGEQATFLADRPMPYCKGCGHGLVARRLDEALRRAGVDPKKVVLTSDIGCVGLVDPLFPTVHGVHAIHGRSTAIAAGAVLADGILADGAIKNVVMIGDGGATIGLLHLSQAALLNVDVTVLLHDNMLYGMTGGQHSGFTPEGFSTSTTPHGNWLPALDMEQVLRGSQGTWFARKLATDADLADVIAQAIAHPGFAVVEILELCTGFGVPLNRDDGLSLRARAQAQGHALGVLLKRDDRRPYDEIYRERFPRREAPAAAPAPVAAATPEPRRFAHALKRPVTVVLAGSAGERVQSAAALACQAALLSGLHVVQKNDYPVTVGSGFSLAELKLSPEPILFTGTESPDAVLVVSADGWKEVRGRGDVSRLAPDAVVLADESVAASLPAGAATALPLRAKLGGEAAALGALVAWMRRTGLLEIDALRKGVEAAGGRGAESLRATIDAALTLG